MNEPRNVKDLLIQLKDASELMVDLAYAAVFFNEDKLAREVARLESRMSDDLRELRATAMLAARSPEMYRDQFQSQLDVLPWLQQQETGLIKAFDANDWIYQTWAYDRHDVGTTPGFNGDYVKALRAIKAKTLMLLGTKDLLNPEWEPQEAARYIRDVRVKTISPGTVTGHAAAGGGFPADVDFINRETGEFLELVTDRGRKLQ